jgi:hypothetical protein
MPIKAVEQGAATSVYCSVAPDIVSGGYYGDCARLVPKKVSCTVVSRCPGSSVPVGR